VDDVAPAEIRETMLALADNIDELAAEALTPQECYDQLGLERVLGKPYQDWHQL
jgi:hypothetical protein